jgi:hypothetical protein
MREPDVAVIRADILNKSVPEPNSGCWLWEGLLNEDGYGVRMCRAWRTKSAHRVSYIAFVGAIPEGLTIDHLCRVRCCVNPQHLEAVTHKVNTLRGNRVIPLLNLDRGLRNREKTHCLRGHPLSGDNLYMNPSGARTCRACVRMHHAYYRGRPL